MAGVELLEGYLSPEQVAAEIKKSARTLALWRHLKVGPPYVKMGKSVLYPVDGFREWLVSKTKNPEQRSKRGRAA
jgi:hypothetical protein